MEKTFQVKSVMIGRKPGKDKEGLKSAFIGLFDENNPHLKGRAPFEVLDLPEVEKVRLHDLRNVSYYLMGNDLVINNLTEVTIKKDGHILTLTGKQTL
jgi:hypothetical protein